MRIFITLLVVFLVVIASAAYWLTSSSYSSIPELTSVSENKLGHQVDLNVVHQNLNSLDAASLKHPENEPSDLSDRKAREQALLASLPRSLRNTDVNGGFQVDEQGHLILSSSNKDFFEYFLSALGEESLEQVKDRITQLIDLSLESPAKEEAIGLLESYIEMKRALMELETQVGEGLSQYGESTIEQQRARMDMVSALRRQYLGDEAADAFYSESEGYDQYMLDKLAITSNKSLSEKQQAEAMVQLMEQAPESVKPRLEDDYKMQRLRLDVATLRDEGAGEEAIYQARSEVLGEAAARRLQQVDQAQAKWNQRYQEYSDQREQLVSEGLSEAVLNDELTRLQNALFEPQEVRRVQALDRLNAPK